MGQTRLAFFLHLQILTVTLPRHSHRCTVAQQLFLIPYYKTHKVLTHPGANGLRIFKGTGRDTQGEASLELL